MLLDYTMEKLDEVKHKQDGKDELCWCSLMEKWLLTKGTPSYPASWEGLCHLLVDAEASHIAKLLWKAVVHAIPPPSPNATNSSTKKPSKIDQHTCISYHNYWQIFDVKIFRSYVKNDCALCSIGINNFTTKICYLKMKTFTVQPSPLY